MIKVFVNDLNVCEIALARPPVNALSLDLMRRLRTELVRHTDRPIVMYSLLDTFCAGLDTNEILDRGSAEEHLDELAGLFRVIIEHPQMTVSVVRGPAVAGGVGLALRTGTTAMGANAWFRLPGKAQYQPLAETLRPIIYGCRPGVTETVFDSWYTHPANAEALAVRGIVRRSEYANSLREEGISLAVAANPTRTPERSKPSAAQWADFERLKRQATRISGTQTFRHSLWLESQKFEKNRDKKQVFLVHGRNTHARDAMANLLGYMGISVIDWDTVAKECPWEAPYFVIATGLAKAQAMIVLLTAEDIAMLRNRFWNEDHDTASQNPAAQPRQNVLIEAGMGLGMCELRTILVQLDQCRPASDFKDLDIVPLGTHVDELRRLESRLEDAGCQVRRSESPERLQRAEELLEKAASYCL